MSGGTVGPDEEMDMMSSVIILEEYGIDRETLADDLRTRMEREAQGLREKGESVPPLLMEALASFGSARPSTG